MDDIVVWCVSSMISIKAEVQAFSIVRADINAAHQGGQATCHKEIHRLFEAVLDSIMTKVQAGRELIRTYRAAEQSLREAEQKFKPEQVRLLKENSDLTVELKHTTKSRDEYDAERNALTTDNANLAMQLDRITRERDTLLANKASLTADLQTMSQAKDNAVKERDRLATDGANLTLNVNKLTAERDTLATRLAAVVRARDTLITNLKLVAQASAMYQALAADLHERLDASEKERLSLQGTIDIQAQTIQRQKDEASAQGDSQSSKTVTAIDVLKTILEDFVPECKGAFRSLSTAVGGLSTNMSKLDIVKSEVDSVKQHYNVIRGQGESSKIVVGRLETSLKQLVTDTTTSAQKTSTGLNTLEQKMKDLGNDITTSSQRTSTALSTMNQKVQSFGTEITSSGRTTSSALNTMEQTVKTLSEGTTTSTGTTLTMSQELQGKMTVLNTGFDNMSKHFDEVSIQLKDDVIQADQAMRNDLQPILDKIREYLNEAKDDHQAHEARLIILANSIRGWRADVERAGQVCLDQVQAAAAGVAREAAAARTIAMVEACERILSADLPEIEQKLADILTTHLRTAIPILDSTILQDRVISACTLPKLSEEWVKAEYKERINVPSISQCWLKGKIEEHVILPTVARTWLEEQYHERIRQQPVISQSWMEQCVLQRINELPVIAESWIKTSMLDRVQQQAVLDEATVKKLFMDTIQLLPVIEKTWLEGQYSSHVQRQPCVPLTWIESRIKARLEDLPIVTEGWLSALYEQSLHLPTITESWLEELFDGRVPSRTWLQDELVRQLTLPTVDMQFVEQLYHGRITSLDLPAVKSEWLRQLYQDRCPSEEWLQEVWKQAIPSVDGKWIRDVYKSRMILPTADAILQGVLQVVQVPTISEASINDVVKELLREVLGQYFHLPSETWMKGEFTARLKAVLETRSHTMVQQSGTQRMAPFVEDHDQHDLPLPRSSQRTIAPIHRTMERAFESSTMGSDPPSLSGPAFKKPRLGQEARLPSETPTPARRPPQFAPYEPAIHSNTQARRSVPTTASNIILDSESAAPVQGAFSTYRYGPQQYVPWDEIVHLDAAVSCKDVVLDKMKQNRRKELETHIASNIDGPTKCINTALGKKVKNRGWETDRHGHIIDVHGPCIICKEQGWDCGYVVRGADDELGLRLVRRLADGART